MAVTTSATRDDVEVGRIGRRLLAGAVGGLAGGVVFGMLMAMMGTLTTIAGMVGSSSQVVGFGIHLMISVGYGLVFGLLAARWLGSWRRGLPAAVGYAVVLWVIGPLVMMPVMLGGRVLDLGSAAWLSLMGHVVYALVLVAVAIPIARRRA
jgi:uncharacterized membrane protein YagU involved in acid resistance